MGGWRCHNCYVGYTYFQRLINAQSEGLKNYLEHFIARSITTTIFVARTLLGNVYAFLFGLVT